MRTWRFFILVTAIALVSFGCSNTAQNDAASIVIEGHISDYDKSISLWGVEASQEIKVDSLGNFRFENDSLKTGFYTLSFGMEFRQSIYLKPGTALNLEIDVAKVRAKDPDAFVISGKNSKETELLDRLKVNKERYKLSSEEYKQEYIPMVYGKNPDDFKEYQLLALEKENKFIDAFAEANPLVDEFFIEQLKLNLLLDYTRDFQIYENYGTFLGREEVEVPESFIDYFADQIPQDDFELFETNAEYARYVLGKYYDRLEKELSEYPRESLEWYKARVTFLESCDFPEIIVERIFDGFVIGYMRTRDEEIRTFITQVINEKVTNEESLQMLAEYKAKEGAYNDGDMVPDFTYPDINGKDISLSDFRGSLVYIDLWATWCVPCLQGIPHYKKLRDDYAGQKIVFLAISLDENVEAWEKKIKGDTEGLFDGPQINTGGYECDISKYFVLSGIPQYVLIGADGRIIKKNAPRPYTEEIVELINENLKLLES